MGGIGFPFLNNRDCDRAKAWGCGGGCGGGCNSGCNSGCGWGGRLSADSADSVEARAMAATRDVAKGATMTSLALATCLAGNY